MFSRAVLLSFLAWSLKDTQGISIFLDEEIPAALTTYSRYYNDDEDGVSLSFSRDYCEDRGLRLAIIQDWTLLDSLGEPYGWDEMLVESVKSPYDLYFRDPEGKISTNGLNYEAEGTTAEYGNTHHLALDNEEIEVRPSAENAGGFICEIPYIIGVPEKDVGYVTCEPYEEWEIVSSTIDLGFDEARQFCKDQDGEMLPMYTKHDVDWAVATGNLGPHVYWQDFKNDPFDNTLRWPNGYALLPGDHPLTPFYIAPDEKLWDQDYQEFHHFAEFSALVYNHGTTTAGFIDIRSYSARAVCKVHISVKDECESDPCENGGTCLDQVGDYYCACTKDYTGKNCEMEVNDCAPNPCYNGGMCYTNDESEWECACPSGFSGDRCQNNANECESSPCENAGVCFDGLNGYTCSCPAKVEGPNCDLDTRGCNINSCNNRGTCLELPDPYETHCVNCHSGYYGDECELRLMCSSSPCQKGTCYNLRDENDYLCTCPQGYGGKNCEERDCSYLDCFNGGSRILDGLSSVCRCLCTADYNGDNCEDKIVVLTPDPCLNRCPYEICDVINDRAVCRPPEPTNPPPPPPTPAPFLSSRDELIIGLCVGGGVLLIIIILVVVCFRSRPAAPTVVSASPPQPLNPYPYSYGSSPYGSSPYGSSPYGSSPYAFKPRQMGRQMAIMNRPFGRFNYGFGYP